MAKPKYERQPNRQVAAVNMTEILADIFTAYPEETLDDMAGKIGHPVATIKTWRRTGRARKKEAEALIQKYPIPHRNNIGSNQTSESNAGRNLDKSLTLSDLLDLMQTSLDELRKRLVA